MFPLNQIQKTLYRSPKKEKILTLKSKRLKRNCSVKLSSLKHSSKKKKYVHSSPKTKKIAIEFSDQFNSVTHLQPDLPFSILAVDKISLVLFYLATLVFFLSLFLFFFFPAPVLLYFLVRPPQNDDYSNKDYPLTRRGDFQPNINSLYFSGAARR